MSINGDDFDIIECYKNHPDGDIYDCLSKYIDKTPNSGIPEVFVVVQGGVVSDVFSTDMSAVIHVVDLDNPNEAIWQWPDIQI